MSEEQASQVYEHVSAAKNPAVALCYKSYSRALEEAEEQGRGRAAATLLAREIYRKAMPPLSGRENIRDFIACIAHGMLLRIIDSTEGTRLLYAAQVAQSSAEREPPNRKPV